MRQKNGRCCGAAPGNNNKPAAAAVAFRAARCGLSAAPAVKRCLQGSAASVWLSVRPVRTVQGSEKENGAALRGCSCCLICCGAPALPCCGSDPCRGCCRAAPGSVRRSSAEVPARPLPSLWILSGIRVPSFPGCDLRGAAPRNYLRACQSLKYQSCCLAAGSLAGS